MIQSVQSLKKVNTVNIFRQFLENEDVTKQELISALGLTLPTINKNTDYLLNEGLISITGTRGKTGGRNAITYALEKEAKIAIGLDVTKHHIRVVAVNLKGEIISYTRKWLPMEDSEDYFCKVGMLVDEFVKKLEIDPARILGVGIGVPALVEADNRTIFYSEIIEGLNVDTYEAFQKYIPYKISMYNDAKAAVFAEWWENKEMDNVFYILLSNNVGGALFVNGRVYFGNGFKSSEVGHMTLVPDGRQCYCGQKGCSDAYLAATNLSSDNLEGFFQTLSKGLDVEVMKAWDEYLDNLAAIVKNVNVLLDCDIIIGGYVGAYMEPYIDELRERTAKLSTFERNGNFIKLCLYKNESIAAGSALHFIDEFIQKIGD